MCTIGVKRFGKNDYILFKNKDFGREAFDDRLVVEPDVFGVVGVSTWAGSAPAVDGFSGLSLGANEAGLFCCDANVAGGSDQSNYDELVEVALRAGESIGGAIGAVQAAVAERSYLWGNLIMIDALGAAALEIRDQTVAVRLLSSATARSNHHLELGAENEAGRSGTTVNRLAAAQSRLEAVGSLEDVFELQDSHDQGLTGLCSHEGHQTVYSYVLRRRHDETTLYVAQGHPCDAAERIALTVPIGRRWSEAAAMDFRDSYPSAQGTNQS